MEEFDYRINQS